MSRVVGSMSFALSRNGDRIDGRLYTTNPLVQFYKSGTGAAIPDWTVADNQPVIYPVIRSQNTGGIRAVTSGTEKFYYNGVVITFGSNGVATAPAVIAGKVKKLDAYNNGSVNVPAIQFIDNVADENNTDADTIRMTCDVEIAGSQLAFDSSITIEISEYTDAGYKGFIAVTNGGIVNTNNPSIVLTPTLLKSGTIMTSGFSVKWKRAATGSTIATTDTLTLTADDIDSRESIMCVFVVDGIEQTNAFVSVSDETDPLYLDYEFSQGSTDFQEDSVDAVVTYKIRRKGTGAEVSGFTFTTSARDITGATFTLSQTPSTTGFRVTVSDMVRAGDGLTINTIASDE